MKKVIFLFLLTLSLCIFTNPASPSEPYIITVFLETGVVIAPSGTCEMQVVPTNSVKTVNSGNTAFRGQEYTNGNYWWQLSGISPHGVDPTLISGTTYNAYYWETLINTPESMSSATRYPIVVDAILNSGTTHPPIAFYPEGLGIMGFEYVCGVNPLAGVTAIVRVK